MDKYLEAINSEEDKLRKLNSKKTELTNVNRTRKEEIKKYKKDEKRLESEQDFNLERRDFLQNKKSYIKSFFVAALKFGAKSSLSFWIIVIFVAILNYNLGNIFNLVFSDILLGNIAVSSLLGYVEYYSVSRYFYDVIRGYKGDINQDIELTNQEILEVKRKRTNAEEMVSSNELLLQELDSVISEVKSKILVLRTNRNSLIESLINELDNYIEDFEYQESDIQKVLEKKIQ